MVLVVDDADDGDDEFNVAGDSCVSLSLSHTIPSSPVTMSCTANMPSFIICNFNSTQTLLCVATDRSTTTTINRSIRPVIWNFRKITVLGSLWGKIRKNTPMANHHCHCHREQQQQQQQCRRISLQIDVIRCDWPIECDAYLIRNRYVHRNGLVTRSTSRLLCERNP